LQVLIFALFFFFSTWCTTVCASGVRDFETVSFQIRTEPSRLFIKHFFKTDIRQRRIGGG
jgi:hypothetical protein